MWLTGLVAPRHVGSSQTRARTRVPCISRQILNHCPTREALQIIFNHHPLFFFLHPAPILQEIPLALVSEYSSQIQLLLMALTASTLVPSTTIHLLDYCVAPNLSPLQPPVATGARVALLQHVSDHVTPAQNHAGAPHLTQSKSLQGVLSPLCPQATL